MKWGEVREPAMKGEILLEWQKLCQQAATEQDPEKLLDLVKRINCLLEQKERRLLENTKKQGS
jgi:hypothetical protein